MSVGFMMGVRWRRACHQAASPEKPPRTHDGAGLGAKFHLSLMFSRPAPDSQAPAPPHSARTPKEGALPRFTSPNPLLQNMKNSDTGGRCVAGLEARGSGRKSRSPTPVGCGTGRTRCYGKLQTHCMCVARREEGR